MTFIFTHGAQQPDRILKQYQYPEFAFVGRSNVGKSSLINAVTNQKNLARTSKTPGRTQQVNYFLNEKNKLYIVDLPGYGFSKVENKLKKEWSDLMDAYFHNNPKLKCVFILVDIRRGVMDSDELMLQYLRALNIPYKVVLTKCDKRERAENLPQGVIQTSITDKSGILELQKALGLI